MSASSWPEVVPALRAEEAPAPAAAAAARWSLPTRIAFRFLFVYFGVSAEVLRQPDPSTLILDGTLDGRNVEATLRKAPLPEHLLTTRGFHWINEYPYNR